MASFYQTLYALALSVAIVAQIAYAGTVDEGTGIADDAAKSVLGGN